jgi:hypothetical protein
METRKLPHHRPLQELRLILIAMSKNKAPIKYKHDGSTMSGEPFLRTAIGTETIGFPDVSYQLIVFLLFFTKLEMLTYIGLQ